ncbi:MAG: MCP four helix bundle domain-containing protein [Desulfomonile tiedjei]|nr:MCP four helix bundle domain-containing protein [Desulfomonile tiedjei]
MWKPVGLPSRIILMLAALVTITVGGAVASIWHTCMMERFFNEVVESVMPSLKAAEELRSSLVMQKGYATYFFQDGDPQWLEELSKRHAEFERTLEKTRQTAETEEERHILREVDAQYVRFAHLRDEVLGMYKAGKRDEGRELQGRVRKKFFNIIDLAYRFQQIREERVLEAQKRIHERAGAVNQMALVALAVALVLGVVLGSTLIRNVLQPIHRLAMGGDASEIAGQTQDDVKALTLRFHGLMKDVDQTKKKLDWSRQHLLQAEKWAMVGKLAAGVAHSVRNPLTSVKMRLFSMERSLHLEASEKEDFEVISEEIRHIDTIVNNFLEFSRPPKLKMRLASPSETVDMTLQLLKHRLDSYNVRVQVSRNGPLPTIVADPDQLKEVLVNLIVNACEAMVEGGEIRIEEETGISENVGPVVVIKVSDNGPGVPEAIQSKLFQPFFSTKGEGTGLGLSIATRIVEDHGGWLDLKSEEGKGASFIITLPAREDENWAQS